MTTVPAVDGVTSRALIVAAGITYRQLDHWTRRGHLSPLPGPGGTGHYRRYPVAAVHEARLLGQLVRLGFRDLDVAADLARRLVHTGRADVPLASDRHLRLTLLNGVPTDE